MPKNINPEELRQVVTLLSNEYSDSLSPSNLAFLQYGYLYSKLVIEPAREKAQEWVLHEFNAEFRQRMEAQREQ